MNNIEKWSTIPNLQSIHISADLKIEEIFELGRRGPYYKHVHFPKDIVNEITKYVFESEGKYDSNKILGLEHFLGNTKYELTLDTIYKDLGIHKCDCSTKTLFEEGCKCGGC